MWKVETFDHTGIVGWRLVAFAHHAATAEKIAINHWQDHDGALTRFRFIHGLTVGRHAEIYATRRAAVAAARQLAGA